MGWCRSIKWSALLLFFLVAGLYATGQAQEMVEARRNAPEILRCTPASVTPGTAIDIQGFRLGWPEAKDLRVHFVQGETQFAVRPTGGGWQAANLEGLQHLKINVPPGVAPGSCQIYVEAGGLASEPITIDIAWMAPPPVISQLSPRWAQPGEVIWINGMGFGVSDEVELVDARGQEHRYSAGATSSGMTVAFTLPTDLPDGEATLWVVEKRSGNEQRSNPIAFSISSGPVPLDLWANWLNPVAAGQWLDLVATSVKPLENIDKAEILFTQQQKKLMVPIVGKSYPRVQVPTQLSPGEVNISTRTWRNGRPSVWSEPVSYQLLANPSAPLVMSIEVASLPEPIYLNATATNQLNLRAGDILTLRGRYPVADADRLRLIMTANSTERIKLKPQALDPGGIRIEIPKEMKSGIWELSIRNLESNTTSKLPINLNIE
jgi:hypothetical protein